MLLILRYQIILPSRINHVVNTCEIVGDVLLGGRDDELRNSGYIDGDIDLGDDDDLYFGIYGTVEYGANIYMGSGNDTMEGGDGRERVYDGSGDDEVELGGGNDYVRGGGGVDSYNGGAGRDYISCYDSSNGIRIDLRDNEISGSWGNNDTIKDFEGALGSKTGDDRMLGNDEANTLQPYGGDDRLYGRGGNDKLRGGNGKDTIKDFENNIDVIELDNFGFATKAEAFALASDSGGDVIFNFGADGVLTVENATISQLQNDLDIV